MKRVRRDVREVVRLIQVVNGNVERMGISNVRESDAVTFVYGSINLFSFRFFGID